MLGHIPTDPAREVAEPTVNIKPVLLNTNSPWSAFLCGSQGLGKSHMLFCILENCLLTNKQLLSYIGKNLNPLAGLAAYLCSQIPTTYKKISDDHGGDIKILRDMACKIGGVGAFDYHAFKKELEEIVFLDRQSGPLKMRIKLLKSFLNLSAGSKSDYLTSELGTLTIIDLTNPVIDADSACTECGKIMAVDKVHNYMSNDSTVVKTVMIVTQEPTINTQLLDLCSITIVHQCTSLVWFVVLKKHITALYLTKDDKALFQQIVRLKLGESLLFCPIAAVQVAGDAIERIVNAYVRFRTRQRVTADRGLSKLAGNK
ncbi:hypothetical protein K469DRAFT_734157 [Zopfia rhizophila CBS 207.26]|uniref:Uncharacterized protein n=1 Tax=Zopfia rhizophila CBS 207.26 TaxID=1314779 RepID=A0A6A6EWN4_9PEZI|nr:hypothetical protein K469DRAFT_734157 [Zopfia rhizophila CBS 207.26]